MCKQGLVVSCANSRMYASLNDAFRACQEYAEIRRENGRGDAIIISAVSAVCVHSAQASNSENALGRQAAFCVRMQAFEGKYNSVSICISYKLATLLYWEFNCMQHGVTAGVDRMPRRVLLKLGSKFLRTSLAVAIASRGEYP